MKKIYFPGNMRQACEAWYGVTRAEDDSLLGTAQIMIVQTDTYKAMGTSLWNCGEELDMILNRVLSTELAGIATSYMQLFSALHIGGTLHAKELPIYLDIDDYISKGNRHDVLQTPAQDWIGTLKNLAGLGNKQYSIWSGDIVGGCARAYTNLDEGKSVDAKQVRAMMDKMSCPF